MKLSIDHPFFRPIDWCQKETNNLITDFPVEGACLELARRILVLASAIIPLIGLIANYFLEPTLYSERQRAQVLADLDPYFIPDLANMIADYAVTWEFGAEEWERVFGVRVEPLPMPPELLAWLDEFDAIDLQEKEINPDHIVRRNSESHFPPILVPKTITRLDIPEAPSEDFCLEVLNRLVQNPREGFYPSQFVPSNFYSLIKNIVAEASRWAIARKEVVGRDQTDDEQKANYFRPLPSFLSVATIAQVLRVQNPNSRFLGDETGNEQQDTYTCTRGALEDRGLDPSPIVIGANAPYRVLERSIFGNVGDMGGLHVTISSAHPHKITQRMIFECLRIALVQEFSAVDP